MEAEEELNEGKEKEKKEEGLKVTFWNVAGIGNKDKEFWKGLENWDVMVLIETWVEEKGWKRLKERLPRGYVWKCQAAKRRNRKGRAVDGMIMGIKKEVIEKGGEEEREVEGLVVGRIRWGRESWRIIRVYVNGDMESKLEELRRWMEGKEGDEKIIGGDFNARTGKEGGSIEMGRRE